MPGLGQHDDQVDSREAGEEQQVGKAVVVVADDLAKPRGVFWWAEPPVQVVGRLVIAVAGRDQVDAEDESQTERGRSPSGRPIAWCAGCQVPPQQVEG